MIVMPKQLWLLLGYLGADRPLMKHSPPEKHLPHLNIDPVYQYYVQKQLYSNLNYMRLQLTQNICGVDCSKCWEVSGIKKN